MADQKIELGDLLRHVLQQRHRYVSPHLFGIGESAGVNAWCRLVVDDLTDDIRGTITKMQEVTRCVLGLDLSVTVYTRHEVIMAPHCAQVKD